MSSVQVGIFILTKLDIEITNSQLVLDTINAAGSVIPPFIVWGGKTQWESYYNKDDERDATFAVSETGYMDDELGMLYISQHFEPHTQTGRPRILIVDGHSSHIFRPVVQFALDHNIHLIQLLSKSTHILQPLDVGCFALLQATYERYHNEWLTKNPFGVIRKVDFLELLFNTRNEVYTISIVKSAWKATEYWPIDINRVRWVPEPQAESESESNVRALSLDTSILDTPLRIRKLARETQKIILDDSIDNGAKVSLFQSLVDIATAKIATYHDIAPRATTLNTLRNGKTRTNRGPSRRVGTGRVLSLKLLNEGLKKLELAEAAKIQREKAALKRRLVADERKIAKQALEIQWRLDLDSYANEVTAWREKVATLDAEWREERDQA